MSRSTTDIVVTVPEGATQVLVHVVGRPPRDIAVDFRQGPRAPWTPAVLTCGNVKIRKGK